MRRYMYAIAPKSPDLVRAQRVSATKCGTCALKPHCEVLLQALKAPAIHLAVWGFGCQTGAHCRIVEIHSTQSNIQLQQLQGQCNSSLQFQVDQRVITLVVYPLSKAKLLPHCSFSRWPSSGLLFRRDPRKISSFRAALRQLTLTEAIKTWLCLVILIVKSSWMLSPQSDLMHSCGTVDAFQLASILACSRVST